MNSKLTVQYLFADSPLYERIGLGDDDDTIRALRDLETTRVPFNSYCVECKQDSVFHLVWPEEATKKREEQFTNAALTHGIHAGLQQSQPVYKPKLDVFYPRKHVVAATAYCMRNDEHTMNATFIIEDHSITKIGQYPTYADISQGDIRKYRPVLSNYAEFSRAIGLASADVGIGSFVYLRRIIEKLIEEAHNQAKSEKGWDEPQYQKARVGERIQLLKDMLPHFLTQNPSIYGILSKGIHELTEQECLQSFDVLRTAIELILDEKLEAAERTKKIRKATKALNQIGGAGMK